MSGIRRALVTLLMYLLAAAAFLAVYLHLGDRLPEHIAAHFTGSGADDYSSRGSFLATSLGVLGGLGALCCGLSALRGTPAQQRALTVLGCAVAGILGYGLTAVLLVNADAADVTAVRLPWWQLLTAVGVGAVTGAAGWLLSGRARPETDRRGPAGPVEQLTLSDGESAAWTQAVGSRVLPLVGLGTLVLAVVLGLTDGPLPAVVLLVVGVPLTALTKARVTVDRRGVTIASSAVPRPRLTIPLERVVDASRREVNAVQDFGGWGYRAASGASGVILRSGEALSVRLTSGSEFVVTVDDAATAAALLNTLAARERTARGR
ncbi:DUF1648 domain-containing protein [Streptomyces thioluteus]|uniref:DUF1648 domain-containing protein n=1 Tax=Streptomyces thioluteus TaxID=66431 RepID=A0ABN3WBZ1_STRTU